DVVRRGCRPHRPLGRSRGDGRLRADDRSGRPARPRLDVAERAVGTPAAGCPGLPLAAAGAGGGRLGRRDPHGVRLHRLARRQAGPLAGPEQQARRPARSGGRPALHRQHPRRARAARDRPRLARRGAGRPRVRPHRPAPRAAPLRVPAAAGALPRQGRDPPAAVRLPRSAAGRRQRVAGHRHRAGGLGLHHLGHGALRPGRGLLPDPGGRHRARRAGGHPPAAGTV
ncbi:MAG: CDP-diacylglycerol--glycerol-3-phosphate 3-phosphatidyltransferase, partial [uncultured Blastococcus sp.]